MKHNDMNNACRNKAYRSKLEQYLTALLPAKHMLTAGVISHEDFLKIDAMLAEKFGIPTRSLYRGIDLILRGTDGNMSHCKEVSVCQE